MEAKSQAAGQEEWAKMADENKKKSFLEILAIVITAIAAVLGGLNGVAALITAMNSGKEGTAKTESVPPTQAAPTAQPSSVPSANDEEARRAKVEAAEAKARAVELELKLAEIASAEVKAKEDAAAAKARAVELAKKLAESGKEAAAAEQLEEKPVEPKQGDIIIDDFTGMKLAYVPGGCFDMGSPPNEEDNEADRTYAEGPVHKVCVDSFWMGQYEVTQGQWEKVMGDNPSKSKESKNYPVEYISWNDAQAFTKKLNSLTGKSYRLPTEAEWEYACRANSPGKYCGGDEIDDVVMISGGKNFNIATHVVGGKKANAFGLHDMSGNVMEWCADWYDSGYYASSPKDNPQGPDEGEERVLRGGSSWYYCQILCRAANRMSRPSEFKDDDLGFRLALPLQ